MATYYSQKSKEPKFGSFIRLLIGLPFVKIQDISRGMKNIEKVANLLKVKKCSDFAQAMLKYMNDFWMQLPLELWNVYNVKNRTNNLAEGYNFALGSKKVISKHPNPYTLVAVIKEELSIASDNALTIVMSKPRKSKSKKNQRLEKRREELMKSYDRGNIELFLYQATIGNAYLSNFYRIRDDNDPDPFGDGTVQTNPSSETEEEEDDFLDMSYIEVDLTKELAQFDDDLQIIRAEKNRKSPENPSSKPKKPKKVPKNKLQKPVMNSRKSEYYYPPSDKNFANRSDSSVQGAMLREKRRLLDDDQNNSPLMIATAAAALTIMASSIVPESEPEPVNEKPDNETESDETIAVSESTSSEHITVSDSSVPPKNCKDSWSESMEKLKELKFKVSPTQNFTPMDGNCMYHVIADQSHLKDHKEARRKIVESILPLVENESIFWNDEMHISDWIETQMNDGVFGDAYS